MRVWQLFSPRSPSENSISTPFLRVGRVYWRLAVVSTLGSRWANQNDICFSISRDFENVDPFCTCRNSRHAQQMLHSEYSGGRLTERISNTGHPEKNLHREYIPLPRKETCIELE